MSATPDSRPSLPLTPFAGAAIDRAAELRHDPAGVVELLTRTQPRAVATDGRHLIVEADGARLARVDWQGEPTEAVLLGIEDGRPLLAVDLDGLEDESDWSVRGAVRPSAPVRKLSLREAGTALAQAEGGLAAYLSGLLHWHRRHPFCSACGHRTVIEEAGLARRCPNCGVVHFPRTDPVVIMAVESEGRLLLGSRTGWDAERYSVLAGFVSPGETPEEAVVREVREESGVESYDPVYAGSQPWPFPASLMLGFYARSDGGEPGQGDGEMTDVRWFSREELIAMQRGESRFVLPPAVSIARLLIDEWVAHSA